MQPGNCLVKTVAFGLIAASLSLAVFSSEPSPDTLTAGEILDRVAKVYAECKSYQDSGLVKTIFFKHNRKWTDTKPFRTAFVRPNHFRYEFSERMPVPFFDYRYVIWQNGKEIETWWDIKPGVHKPESLNMALAGATGVSGGSAYVVPSLLLPEETKGSFLASVAGAKRDNDDVFNGASCFKIDGMLATGTVTIWIEKKSLLLLRIDQQQQFPDFRAEQTTTYEPVMDEAIPDKLLRFNAPTIHMSMDSLKYAAWTLVILAIAALIAFIVIKRSKLAREAKKQVTKNNCTW